MSKVDEAIQWVEKHHVGLPLSPDELEQILVLADRRHRRRWGLPIFRNGIDLNGLYNDTESAYIGGLSSSEKRILTSAYTFMTPVR